MTSEQTTQDKLQEIGRCAYASIVEMVAALQCDYERLQELRESKERDVDKDGQRTISDEEIDELAALEEAAGECESEDDARQRIMDPLSLQLRSGWYLPGETPESEEFELLLGTGGPAVRIIGKLDQHKEPCEATLQAQDWFTPWTDYLEADEKILLAYCRVFYFGE